MFKLVVVLLAFFTVVMTQTLPDPSQLPKLPKLPVPVPPIPGRVAREATDFPMPGSNGQILGSGNSGLDKLPEVVDPTKWIEKGQQIATKIGETISGGRRRRNV